MVKTQKGVPTTTTTDNNTGDKRTSRELEEEGRASKAIRNHSTLKERSRRLEGDVLNEEPNRKIMRAHEESQGEVTKIVILHRPVFNPEGAMVDSIDSV